MDLIHNRLEKTIIQKIKAEGAKCPTLSQNEDLLADAACIALNALRPHYIRHDVDLSFFLSEAKRAQDEREMNAAVKSAIERILRDEKTKAQT